MRKPSKAFPPKKLSAEDVKAALRAAASRLFAARQPVNPPPDDRPRLKIVRP